MDLAKLKDMLKAEQLQALVVMSSADWVHEQIHASAKAVEVITHISNDCQQAKDSIQQATVDLLTKANLPQEKLIELLGCYAAECSIFASHSLSIIHKEQAKRN